MSLRPFTLPLLGLISLPLACGQDGSIELASTEQVEPNEVVTRVIGEISKGIPAPPAPAPAFPDSRVIKTFVHQLGDHVVSVRKILPPDFSHSDVTAQSPVEPDDTVDACPAPAGKTEEVACPESRLAVISADVHDHQKTFVRWRSDGERPQEFAGWCNLDFNHFTGVGDYQVLGRDGALKRYSLIMAIGNTRAENSSAEGSEIHSSPEFPMDRPTFVLTQGDAGDTETMAVIDSLLELYRAEAPRLQAAYAERERNWASQREYEQKHPMVRQDVSVRFWKPGRPESATKQEEDL